MGVTLGNWSAWVPRVSDAYNLQAHSDLSQGYRGRAQPLKSLGPICILHTTLVQPSHLINPVSMSAPELRLPAGESPGDPGTHQPLSLPWLWLLLSLQLGPDSKVLALWRVLSQSLSWRGNVGQCLLSQIRLSESRCVIKRNSQEARLELFDDCLKGFDLVIWVKKLNPEKSKGQLSNSRCKGKSTGFEPGGPDKWRRKRLKWE